MTQYVGFTPPITTMRNIAQSAFESLGVRDPGQPITGAQANRALYDCNEMLDSWSAENLMCFAYELSPIPLVAGTSQYTIGVGATINQPRPDKIEDICFIEDDNSNRYPVDVVEQDVWNRLGNLTVTSQIPDTLYYDPQMPWGIINIFPTPSIDYNLYVCSFEPLTQFANLDQELILPRGYQAALTSNLALYMEDKYPMPPQDFQKLVMKAGRLIGVVKRKNLRIPTVQYDNVIVSRARSTYNIYRDQ